MQDHEFIIQAWGHSQRSRHRDAFVKRIRGHKICKIWRKAGTAWVTTGSKRAHIFLFLLSKKSNILWMKVLASTSVLILLVTCKTVFVQNGRLTLLLAWETSLCGCYSNVLSQSSIEGHINTYKSGVWSFLVFLHQLYSHFRSWVDRWWRRFLRNHALTSNFRQVSSFSVSFSAFAVVPSCQTVMTSEANFKRQVT